MTWWGSQGEEGLSPKDVLMCPQHGVMGGVPMAGADGVPPVLSRPTAVGGAQSARDLNSAGRASGEGGVTGPPCLWGGHQGPIGCQSGGGFFFFNIQEILR